MAKNGNVEVQGLSRFTSIQNLFVSGNLTTSGSVSVGETIFDVNSHLILSSSAGSVVYISGTLSSKGAGASSEHFGQGSVADGIQALALGNNAYAGDDGAVAVGLVSSASSDAVSVGHSSTALGINAVGIGWVANANGSEAISIGSISKALAQNSVAVGRSARAMGVSSVAVGTNTSASFLNSIAIGDQAFSPAASRGRWGSYASPITLEGMSDLVWASLYSSSSFLILSSSVGSVVALSSSQDFVNTDKPWHIRAVNSHLILSSSAGSIVTISGTLSASNGAAGLIILNAISAIQGGTGGNGSLLVMDAQNVAGRFSFGDKAGSTSIRTDSATGNVFAVTTHLILSSSVGSIVTVSGGFKVQGSIHEDVKTVTANTTFGLNDSILFGNATGASFKIYLPSPVPQGRRYTAKIIASGSNNITLSGSASETIDGATTYLLDVLYESVTVIGSGSVWNII